MKEKDNVFQEQDTVIWSALRQHVGRRQQKVLAGEKLQLGISEQMAPSSNPCREAEQSVSSHCCCGTSLCIPPRDMLYLRKPLAEYINRQKVNTCKELKGASLSLQFQKIFCLFIKMKNKPMPKKKKKTLKLRSSPIMVLFSCFTAPWSFQVYQSLLYGALRVVRWLNGFVEEQERAWGECEDRKHTATLAVKMMCTAIQLELIRCCSNW